MRSRTLPHVALIFILKHAGGERDSVAGPLALAAFAQTDSQNFARSGLLLVGAGAALAAGDAGPVSDAWSGLELAQAHEHGQQWSGEHAPPTVAQQPSPEHQQRPP